MKISENPSENNEEPKTHSQNLERNIGLARESLRKRQFH